MTRYTGGCLCGAVRYSIDTETGPMRQLLVIVLTVRSTQARLSYLE